MQPNNLPTLIEREIDLERFLAIIGRFVAHRVGSERATIWLIEAESKQLFCRLTSSSDLDELRLSLKHGLVGRCARSRETIFVANVQSDADWNPEIDRATGFRTRSMCCVPIPDGNGALLGVIQALNLDAKRSRQDTIDRLELIAKELSEAFNYTSLRPDAGCHGVKIRGRFNHIVGRSTAMNDVYSSLSRAAAFDATVLLRGETGTGKGLFARAIHVNSPRSEHHFVYVDCTTLPASLVESELFGHERGAFTGADRQTPGKVEVADGGTLFIDEIGELPLPLQGKLLRFVQDREFVRVGGRQTLKSDVRIVTATNRDLARMVDEGQFRADLYYRLLILEIEIPSLRERGADEITLLARHFLDVFKTRFKRPQLTFHESAIAALCAHTWPGNVRELENTIQRAVIMSPTNKVQERDLGFPSPTEPSFPVSGAVPFNGQSGAPLQSIIKAYAEHIVQMEDGNLSAAARTLEISRNRLNRILNG